MTTTDDATPKGPTGLLNAQKLLAARAKVQEAIAALTSAGLPVPAEMKEVGKLTADEKKHLMRTTRFREDRRELHKAASMGRPGPDTSEPA